MIFISFFKWQFSSVSQYSSFGLSLVNYAKKFSGVGTQNAAKKHSAYPELFRHTEHCNFLIHTFSHLLNNLIDHLLLKSFDFYLFYINVLLSILFTLLYQKSSELGDFQSSYFFSSSGTLSQRRFSINKKVLFKRRYHLCGMESWGWKCQFSWFEFLVRKSWSDFLHRKKNRRKSVSHHFDTFLLSSSSFFHVNRVIQFTNISHNCVFLFSLYNLISF